jgi:tetratricopeptide (TPR) repeat protein
MAMVCLYVREPAKALEALRLTNDVILNAQFAGPRRYLTGLAHWMMGNQDAARSEWRAALKTVEEQIAAQANTAPWLAWKAELLAALAQKAEAEVVLRELVQRAAADARFDRLALAKVQVWLGDNQAALAVLEESYKAGVSRGPRTDFRYHPVWEPLRGDPRFEALLKVSEPKK